MNSINLSIIIPLFNIKKDIKKKNFSSFKDAK